MAKKKQLTVDYNRIEKQIWALAEPLAVGLGLELIDVEYVKEAGSWYLRLYIDREPPVDHDCCEKLSGLVSEALDREDPIEQNYFLEVSSPGLNRPLKREADFIRYSGRKVDVTLFAPLAGKKEYQGLLGGLTEQHLILQQPAGEMRIPLEQVARARLTVDF